ncbi:MAG: GDYXXLXY domain-containing protein [Methylococcales bacterium]|nr:GDYXXLXY domain-containing protein [Methylococcales bacterium]
MRKLIVVLTGVLLLVVVNVTIYQREQLRTQGRVVLLELVPVDPRSLMQGDYMALNFAVVNAAFPNRQNTESKDGLLVVTLNERGVASFKRLADTTPLATNEVVLKYRTRNDQVKFATNAFFFEEGQAQQYQVARYGEFRVSADGEMLLTNLRSADLAVLGGV